MTIREAIRSGEGWEDILVRAEAEGISPQSVGQIYEAAFIAAEIKRDTFILAKKRIGAKYDIAI